MGCSIKPTYRKTSSECLFPKISSLNQIKVQPGLFIVQNPNKFHEVYKSVELIGSGTTSEVRICTHRDTNEKRAVKIFHKFSEGEHSASDYKSEIKLMKSVDHPNIVRAYEYFEDTRRVYVVMEYCSGGQLFEEIIKQEYLSEIIAAKIMHQVFSVLFYLDEQKIIHRNLKPENILLEESNAVLNIKIIDFGCAIEAAGYVQGNVGSQYFSAPEVAGGRYCSKADIWSAGIIMCLLLSGQPPYSVANNNKIEYYSEGENYGFSEETWGKTSAEAKDLLRRIFCEENLRLSASECLAHRWIAEKSQRPICNETILKSVLDKLKNFQSFHKLREAVYTFIVTQLVSLKETRVLREVFRAIDANGDGKLSVSELADQYSQTMGYEEAKKEAERIMKEVDTDNNGYIDYTEFLKVNLDSTKVLSSENLKLAFKLFDKDASGAISATELKLVLQGDMQSDDDVWKKFIQMVDQNSDGEIDLQEFRDIVLSNCLE